MLCEDSLGGQIYTIFGDNRRISCCLWIKSDPRLSHFANSSLISLDCPRLAYILDVTHIWTPQGKKKTASRC